MWARRRNPTTYQKFAEFPLQSLVDLLAKAGVEHYDNKVFEALISYLNDITSTNLFYQTLHL